MLQSTCTSFALFCTKHDSLFVTASSKLQGVEWKISLTVPHVCTLTSQLHTRDHFHHESHDRHLNSESGLTFRLMRPFSASTLLIDRF